MFRKACSYEGLPAQIADAMAELDRKEHALQERDRYHGVVSYLEGFTETEISSVPMPLQPSAETALGLSARLFPREGRMDRALRTRFAACAAADTLGAIRLPVHWDIQLASLLAAPAGGAPAGINLIAIQGNRVEKSINRAQRA